MFKEIFQKFRNQIIQLVAKKNGNCQNKIDTFLQFFHSVKSSCERLELWSKFNDIVKNYLIGIVN
jgi:hypothetical protein